MSARKTWRNQEIQEMLKRSFVVRDLRSAGYRLLGPDELDPVTVERCAEVARMKAWNGATADQIAAALRSLTGGGR